MRLRLAIITLWLFIFMIASFSLCLVLGSAMPSQTACEHSGSSVCSMHGEECCLTDLGKAQMRTARRMTIFSLYLREIDYR